MSYSKAGNGDIAIESTVYSKGDFHLSGGMSQVQVLGWIPMAATQALEPYTGSPVTGSSYTVDVAGVLLLSDGQISIDSATRVAGLLCSNGILP